MPRNAVMYRDNNKRFLHRPMFAIVASIVLLSFSMSSTLSVAQIRKTPPKAQKTDGTATKLRQILQKYDKAGTFSGTALIAQNGHILLHEAFGLADRAWNVPNTTDARYPLCSVTKPFTAALILKQVEKGRLRLEQTVGEILTDFKDKPVGSATINQLLTYASGYATTDDLPADKEASAAVKEAEVPWFYRTATPDFSIPSVAANYLLALPPDGKRGGFRYNNTDYIILTAILEKVSGQNYGQLLETELFKPLGLRDIGLLRVNALVPKFTPGYIKTKSGWEREPYVRWENFTGSAALYGTASDLYRWTMALIEGRMLGAEQTKAMISTVSGGGFVAFGGFVYSQKIEGKAWAIVERQGAVGGHRTLLLFVPEDKAVVILLGNTDQFQNSDSYQGKGLGIELLQAIFSASKPIK